MLRTRIHIQYTYDDDIVYSYTIFIYTIRKDSRKDSTIHSPFFLFLSFPHPTRSFPFRALFYMQNKLRYYN